jgi:hypothetical protein
MKRNDSRDMPLCSAMREAGDGGGKALSESVRGREDMEIREWGQRSESDNKAIRTKKTERKIDKRVNCFRKPKGTAYNMTIETFGETHTHKTAPPLSAS